MYVYKIFISILLMLSMNVHGDAEPFFSIEDFSIYHSNYEEPFKLGMSEEEVQANFTAIPGFDEWEVEEAGWKILKHSSNGFSFFEFEIDTIVFSYVFIDSEFSTSRGISVGDSIWDISRKYELYTLNPPPEGTYSRKFKDRVVIQQTFDRDAEHPGDLITDYRGKRWKAYSLSFIYNEDEIITRIFVNKAFEH